jgi:hypothetical protein
METTDEQRPSRSVISNFYYGGVTNVINLKLSKDLVEVLGPGNNIAETINSFINQNTKKNDDDR